MVYELSGVSAETLFQWLTEPAKLTQWWAEEAIVTPEVGGDFIMNWPSISKRLIGKVVRFEPATAFAFTWLWEDDSEDTEKTVTVLFNGTSATLTHAAYSEGALDKQAREDHINGWGYFLGALRDAVK